MKTLLVTGHRGLLGSACVRRLSGRYNIMTYGGDLLDYYAFRSWLNHNRPDAIIHCAAKVGGVKSNRDCPVDFLTINLKIQSTVIESAAFYAIPRLIFVGTSCMFPKGAPLPVSEDSLLTGPFDSSVQAYAIAKLAGYAMCKAYHDQYGFSYCTVSPGNIFGPGDNYGDSAHVIPALIRKTHECIKSGGDLSVWGDGTAIREFIYSDDVADAIGVVLDKWHSPDMVNIGTGVSTTIKEAAKIICEKMGFAGRVAWDNTYPSGVPRKTFDCKRIMSMGWVPKTSMDEGINLTIEDYLRDPRRRLQ